MSRSPATVRSLCVLPPRLAPLPGRHQRSTQSVAELASQGTVDDEVSGRVGDLEHERQSTCDVRRSAAVRTKLKEDVLEHLGRQVADGEDDHDDDDDARHAVLVVGRR